MECVVEHDYKAEEDDELNLSKGDRITDIVTMHDGWWEGLLNGKRGLFPDNFVKLVTSSPNITTSSNTAIGDGAPKMREKSGQKARRVKAIFSYAPSQNDELRLDVGDVIEFMDEIEEGWWKGELKGRVGIFPSNFVAELDAENNVATTTQNGEMIEVGILSTNSSNRESITLRSKVVPDIVSTSVPLPVPPPVISKDDEAESAPKLPPKPGTIHVRETARCFYPYFAANEDELTLQEGDIITILSKECEDEGWWRGEHRGKIGVFPDNFVEIMNPNSPSSCIPSPTQGQPKVIAQERSSELFRNDSKGKEVKPLVAGNGSGGMAVEMTGQSIAVTKGETKLSSQIKPFGIKKDVQPPLSYPTKIIPSTTTSTITTNSISFGSSFISLKSKSPLTSPNIEVSKVDDLNLNSIERGSDKLNHLTITRAKAPRRRPPSAIITHDEEIDSGIVNGGSGSVSLPVASDLATKNAPTTIHVPDGTKEPTPGPQPLYSTVNKPKQAIPWMAELKLKQDTKKSTAHTTLPTTATIPTSTSSIKDNVSTVVVSPPSTPPPASVSVTIPPTKAPPLPAKPNIPPPVSQQSGEKIPAVLPTSIATITPPNPPPPLTKFGPNVVRKSTTPVSTPTGNNSFEWVSMEEYNLLKDRVMTLETELELLKKEIKSILREGQIV